MNELKALGGLTVCSLVFGTVYGVLFSMIYPLVDIDASLISLFGILGFITCAGIKVAWSLLRRKEKA